jgi:hypothetical protein
MLVSDTGMQMIVDGTYVALCFASSGACPRSCQLNRCNSRWISSAVLKVFDSHAFRVIRFTLQNVLCYFQKRDPGFRSHPPKHPSHTAMGRRKQVQPQQNLGRVESRPVEENEEEEFIEQIAAAEEEEEARQRDSKRLARLKTTRHPRDQGSVTVQVDHTQNMWEFHVIRVQLDAAVSLPAILASSLEAVVVALLADDTAGLSLAAPTCQSLVRDRPIHAYFQSGVQPARLAEQL